MQGLLGTCVKGAFVLPIAYVGQANLISVIGKVNEERPVHFIRLKDGPYYWKMDEKLRNLLRVALMCVLLIFGAIVPISLEGPRECCVTRSEPL
jgi:hypothetical protein